MGLSGWEGVPDLAEQDFYPAQKVRQTSLICEKSKDRIMVLKIHFYLVNFFKAHFLLNWHPNLPKIYNEFTESLTAGTMEI